MLQDRYTLNDITAAFRATPNKFPFPRAADRDAWDALQEKEINRQRKAYLLGKAMGLAQKTWDPIPATLYLDCARTGNRARYQNVYFEQVSRLSSLVLAECMHGKGTWLDPIIDGVWRLLEMGTWCLPAHMSDGLPKPDADYVDLFCCQTGLILAETMYLLGDAFDAETTAINEQIRANILRRVVEPVERRDDFWWMNGSNNWSVWCAHTTFGAAMHTLHDDERLATLAHKLMGVTDRFIGNYPPDGGCDEGASYWSVAPGAMLLMLEHLHACSNGTIDIFDEQLIRKMGLFFLAVRLDGQWVFNFGDAGAKAPGGYLLHRYGERIGSAELMNEALLAARGGTPDGAIAPLMGDGSLSHGLRELFWFPVENSPEGAKRPVDQYLENLEIMNSRETGALDTGLVVAAKGGHNDVSHNHNDIGQFVLWADGAPVIVDVGVETYTKTTFSENRYTLWAIRASAHNAPLVNSCEQAPGKEFAATEVQYNAADKATTMQMHLEKAYTADAQLQSLIREVRLERGETAQLIVSDAWATANNTPTLSWTFFTPATVTESNDGCLLLDNGKATVAMRFDASFLHAEVQFHEITDPQLLSSWPSSLTRICLSAQSAPQKGSTRFVFNKVETTA